MLRLGRDRSSDVDVLAKSSASSEVGDCGLERGLSAGRQVLVQLDHDLVPVIDPGRGIDEAWCRNVGFAAPEAPLAQAGGASQTFAPASMIHSGSRV